MIKSRELMKMSVYGIVLGACALGASVVLADWTAPLNGPPTCTSGNPGCDAPLNVSSTAQTKSGSLTIGSSVTAPQYCIGASCISAWPSSGGGGTIGGGGTGGYIPMWSNGTTLGNSDISDNSGVLAHQGASGNWAMEATHHSTSLPKSAFVKDGSVQRVYIRGANATVELLGSSVLDYVKAPVSVVHQPIENSVGESRITDDLVPVFDRKLAGHHGRAAPVPILHDLQEVAPLLC